MQAEKTLHAVVGRYPLDPRSIGIHVREMPMDVDVTDLDHDPENSELDEVLATRCVSL